MAGAVLAVVISWYSVSRIRAANNPLEVYSFTKNAGKTSAHGLLDRLKVSSFNIAHGRGGKYGAKNRSHKSEKELLEHLDKIAGQINGQSPDIIVLNEVDFSSAWSFNIDQAKYIAKKCGYPYLLEQKNMVVSFPFYHLSFGNALLSKYPIQNEVFVDLPPYSELEQIFAGDHNAFFCEVKLPSGPVGVFGIHLEYRSESIRVRCVEILDEICSKKSSPVIALGDFNSTPTGLAKSEVTQSGKNAMSFLFGEKGFISYLEKEDENHIFTFPSEKPDRLIDWIIGKGIRNFSNSRVVRSKLSDHLMIVTEVEI
jgi:endonuclease/exonuclease/phosphatase family metal-dependent hydrolase